MDTNSRVNSNSHSNFRDSGGCHSAPHTEGNIREMKPMDVPEDYVAAADSVIRSIGFFDSQTNTFKFKITMSKLRNILSMASDIYNNEYSRREDELLKQSITAIRKMQVRIVYESGRDPSVGDFIRKTKMIEYIRGIGTSREKFMCFENYLEALVAYHRFYGGKES